TGEGAFETITGIQSVGVMACAKHFITNHQEHWQYGLITEVDDHTMHDSASDNVRRQFGICAPYDMDGRARLACLTACAAPQPNGFPHPCGVASIGTGHCMFSR
ncbi:hypothetical protein C8R46DRAFT_900104, partial [Mycena filopes]